MNIQVLTIIDQSSFDARLASTNHPAATVLLASAFDLGPAILQVPFATCSEVPRSHGWYVAAKLGYIICHMLYLFCLVATSSTYL